MLPSLSSKQARFQPPWVAIPEFLNCSINTGMYIRSRHRVCQADHNIRLTITRISIQTRLHHHFHACRNLIYGRRVRRNTDIDAESIVTRDTDAESVVVIQAPKPDVTDCSRRGQT